MSYNPYNSGTYTTSLPTLTNGQIAPVQLDSSGRQLVVVGTALPAGSNLIGGVELYDGGGTNKLAINSSGYITVDIAASQTIAVTQATAASLLCTATLASGSTIQTVPATSGGCSTTVAQAVGASGSQSASVKGSAGQLYGYTISNPNTSVVYVFYYNVTSIGTIGSTTALILEVMIPAGATANVAWDNGIAFSTGIMVACSTTATGSTAVTTGLTITSLYK